MIEQHKETEKVFFNQYARDGGYERFKENSYKKIFHYVTSMVKPAKGETVLDMGCGTGAFTWRLAQLFPQVKVMGLDISDGCINWAQKQYPSIKFLSGDVEATGLPSRSVDVIFFFGLLHHFPDFSKVAAEAHRILKPGGRFFSFDPNHLNPFFWLYRSHSSPLYSPIGVTPNERLITKKELISVFSKKGFKVRAKVISGVKFLHVESRTVKRNLWFYNFFDRILASTPVARWIGAWVIGVGVRDNSK